MCIRDRDWMVADILQQSHFVLFVSNNVQCHEHTGDESIILLSLACGPDNLLAQWQFPAFRKWTFSAKDVVLPNSASSSAWESKTENVLDGLMKFVGDVYCWPFLPDMMYHLFQLASVPKTLWVHNVITRSGERCLFVHNAPDLSGKKIEISFQILQKI